MILKFLSAPLQIFFAKPCICVLINYCGSKTKVIIEPVTTAMPGAIVYQLSISQSAFGNNCVSRFKVLHLIGFEDDISAVIG